MVKKAQINPTESNSRNFPTKDFSKTISLAGWEQQVFGCRAGRGTGGQGGQVSLVGDLFLNPKISLPK